MSNRILTLSAAITGIALNGVDNAVFAFLHDTDMIGLAILRTRRALIIPIEENDLTGRRFKAAVLPLATILEPLHAVDTGRKFRNNTAVDIAASRQFHSLVLNLLSSDFSGRLIKAFQVGIKNISVNEHGTIKAVDSTGIAGKFKQFLV